MSVSAPLPPILLISLTAQGPPSSMSCMNDSLTLESCHVHDERHIIVSVVPAHRAEVARARLTQHLPTPHIP